MDMSKYMNQVLEVNPQERFARVQPGVVLDVLREAAEAHHLTFAPDPATHTHNTLGGMIGNNSCGVHSVMGGRTSDNILEFDILTYNGTRSCTAVFRDELINLYPHDPQAKRLSQQTFTLGEFLSQRDFPVYPLRGRALVHAHCNHKAIMGMNREQEFLSRLGLDFEILNAGCCGQAGSFGYEADKYEVSIKCAERALAPAVRAAEPGTLIIADGFSCREQIAHLTERRGIHLAQVLQKALHGAGSPKRHES